MQEVHAKLRFQQAQRKRNSNRTFPPESLIGETKRVWSCMGIVIRGADILHAYNRDISSMDWADARRIP